MSQAIEFHYELDQGDFAAITAKLRELAGNKANTYIARALNKTATSARVKLGNKAQASYTVKSGGFKKDMKIDKASAGNLVAVIRSNGDTLSVTKFRWSKGGKSGAKVDVVHGGLKHLGPEKRRAFAYNGAVFVRTGSERVPIEKKKSKSVPYMIGSENRVWGPMRPQVGSDLEKFMRQQIATLIG